VTEYFQGVGYASPGKFNQTKERARPKKKALTTGSIDSEYTLNRGECVRRENEGEFKNHPEVGWKKESHSGACYKKERRSVFGLGKPMACTAGTFS